MERRRYLTPEEKLACMGVTVKDLDPHLVASALFDKPKLSALAGEMISLFSGGAHLISFLRTVKL